MKPAIKRSAAAKDATYAHGGGGYRFRQATLAEGALAESSEATPSAGKPCYDRPHVRLLAWLCSSTVFSPSNQLVHAMPYLCSSTVPSLLCKQCTCNTLLKLATGEHLEAAASACKVLTAPLHKVRTSPDSSNPLCTCCCACTGTATLITAAW